jgi:hypothetical protein
MSSELSPKPEYDTDDFIEKVSVYRYELRKERQVKQKVKAAMSTLGGAVVHLCQVIGEQFKEEDAIQGKAPLLSAELLDDAVLIKSGKRHLTFMTLYGVGSDRELPGARDERCGQIGAYAHLALQEKAPLGSRLMIYGNGDISDGKLTWNLNEGIQGFMPYLSKVLGRYIFQMDLYWQKTEDMPPPFSRAHVIEGTLYIDELRREAVAFTVEKPDDDFEERLKLKNEGPGLK